MGLERLTRELEERGVLSYAIAASIRDVIPLANRAAHGEFVRPEHASDLARLGIRILEELRSVYLDVGVKPTVKFAISTHERDQLDRARYRVTTVIPLVDDPQVCQYELDQQGLDELLDGYSEYAEFVVSVDPINVTLPSNPVP